jgi:hypothetical protein
LPAMGYERPGTRRSKALTRTLAPQQRQEPGARHHKVTGVPELPTGPASDPSPTAPHPPPSDRPRRWPYSPPQTTTQGNHKADRADRGQPAAAQPTSPHHEHHGGNDGRHLQRAADHREVAVRSGTGCAESGSRWPRRSPASGAAQGCARTPVPWSAPPAPRRRSPPDALRPQRLAPPSAERFTPVARSCS